MDVWREEDNYYASLNVHFFFVWCVHVYPYYYESEKLHNIILFRTIEFNPVFI